MLSDRENALFTNYEELLTGKCKIINPNNLYPSQSTYANENLAVRCIRYAVEDILGWTPEQAMKRFDEYTIRDMKLDRLVHYIEFPPEVYENNPRYVLSRMYPDLLPVPREKLPALLYASVRSKGEDSMGGMFKKHFPLNYFVSCGSPDRFGKCIWEVVRLDTDISTLDELYAFFLSPYGKNLLVRSGLKVPARNHPNTMAEVLRGMTENLPNSEAYYRKWKFYSTLAPEDRVDPFTGVDPTRVDKRGRAIRDPE